MKTKLLLLLMLVFAGCMNAAVVYTFSEQFGTGGTIGFTYQAPAYLTGSFLSIPAREFATCDTSGMPPGWDCTRAVFQQYHYPNGATSVFVDLALVYTPDPQDAFSTDDVYDSFPGAVLNGSGTYQGFLNRAGRLTIHGSPEEQVDPAPVPEPATGTLLVLVVAGCFLWTGRSLGTRFQQE